MKRNVLLLILALLLCVGCTKSAGLKIEQDPSKMLREDTVLLAENGFLMLNSENQFVWKPLDKEETKTVAAFPELKEGCRIRGFGVARGKLTAFAACDDHTLVLRIDMDEEKSSVLSELEQTVRMDSTPFFWNGKAAWIANGEAEEEIVLVDLVTGKAQTVDRIVKKENALNGLIGMNKYGIIYVTVEPDEKENMDLAWKTTVHLVDPKTQTKTEIKIETEGDSFLGFPSFLQVSGPWLYYEINGETWALNLTNEENRLLFTQDMFARVLNDKIYVVAAQDPSQPILPNQRQIIIYNEADGKQEFTGISPLPVLSNKKSYVYKEEGSWYLISHEDFHAGRLDSARVLFPQ